MPEFHERRSGRNRRDWEIFTYPDRRIQAERRSGVDRRKSTEPYAGPERRRLAGESASGEMDAFTPESFPEKQHYSTADVAQMTGLSQTTLLLWIRNKVIDGDQIKRTGEGRRLWTQEHITEIRRIKARNGWT